MLGKKVSGRGKVIKKKQELKFLALLSDITERKRQEERYKSLYEFERLISLISIDFINVLNKNLDDLIDQTLKKIGQFVNAARCSLFIFSEDSSMMTNTNEWCIDPSDSQIDILQNIPSEKFGYYLKLLKEKKGVIVNHINDIPSEAIGEREWVKKYGFRSSMFVPMTYKNNLFGTLGFYGEINVEREWSKDIINLLRLLANIFVNSIVRKRTEQKLKESEEIFRNIVESIPLGLHMFEIDSAEKLIFTGSNSTADKILNLNNKQFIGKTIEEAFPPLKETDIPDRLREAAFKGEPSKWEQVTYEDEKIKGAFEVHAFQTSPRKVVSTFTDITERLEAEKKIKESEEKYRSLFENMTVGFAYHKIIVDENNIPIDYQFLEANPAFEKLTGLNTNEIIGKPVTEVLPGIENDPVDWISKYGRVALTGIPITFESYAEPLDQWYSVLSYSPKKGYFAVTFTNITDRKKSVQNLRKSEEKYRLITENANDLIAVLNEKFEYEFINENVYQNILGYGIEDLIGKVNLELIHPEDRKQTTIALSRILRKGKGSHQLRTEAKNGTYKWLEVTAKNFYDSKGRKKILTISRDITDRKIIENSLQKSEQKNRNIVNSIPLGMHMYQVNSEGNLIFIGANSTADKMFNVDNRKFIGKTIEKAFPPIKDTDIPDSFLDAALTGKSSTWDQITYEDEKVKGAYEVHAFQTSPGNMVASFADITERLEIERNLRESEEKFRTIADQSFMGIGIIQEDKIIYANEAISKILEYSLDEIMPWTKSSIVLNMIHPEDLQMLREQRKRRRIDNPNLKPNISYRIITKSGAIKWIDQYLKVIIYHGKEAELISIIDITEKKHAEEIILQENLKLMELNKMREDLIIRVSHELRTPLTSIYGASQILLNHHKKELNKNVLNLVEISHRGGIRLKKLIENLIDTSKLKWEKLILNRKNEDLGAIVDECVEEMMLLAQNRNIIINTDLNNKIFLKVDKLRLEQVITNILSNAIKNTPSLGKIYISIIETKNKVGINIKDTGIGITLEEKKLLFEKFGKIERYGMDLGVDIEGAGLGLFISKEIVELHGGQIIVKSEGRNKGTEVIIELLK